jgi:hypothetical protein
MARSTVTPSIWGRDRGRRFLDLGRAVPGLRRFPDSDEGFGFSPGCFAGLLSAELAAKAAGNVYDASAFFPAAPSFLKFARTGVFREISFASQAVATVKFQGHVISP